MSWTILKDYSLDNTLPLARRSHTATLFGNKVFIFGGSTDTSRCSDVLSFDLADATWERVICNNLPPCSMTCHTGTLVGDEWHLIGNRQHQLVASPKVLHTVLNLQTLRWKVIEPIFGNEPLAVHGHTAVHFANKIWLFGGCVQWAAVNDFYCYDLESCRWSRVISSGSAPSARFFHTAVVWNCKMWIFGGRNRDGVHSDLHVFDFDSCEWIEIKNIQGQAPSSRAGHSASVLDGKMIVYGGWDGSTDADGQEIGAIGSVHFFDFATLSWIAYSISGTAPIARDCHIAVEIPGNEFHGDEIFFFGGSDPNWVYLNECALLQLEGLWTPPSLVRILRKSFTKDIRKLIESSSQATSDLLEGIAFEFLFLRKRGSLQLEVEQKLADEWAANQIATPHKKRTFSVVNIENM